MAPSRFLSSTPITSSQCFLVKLGPGMPPPALWRKSKTPGPAICRLLRPGDGACENSSWRGREDDLRNSILCSRMDRPPCVAGRSHDDGSHAEENNHDPTGLPR